MFELINAEWLLLVWGGAVKGASPWVSCTLEPLLSSSAAASSRPLYVANTTPVLPLSRHHAGYMSVLVSSAMQDYYDANCYKVNGTTRTKKSTPRLPSVT